MPLVISGLRRKIWNFDLIIQFTIFKANFPFRLTSAQVGRLRACEPWGSGLYPEISGDEEFFRQNLIIKRGNKYKKKLALLLFNPPSDFFSGFRFTDAEISSYEAFVRNFYQDVVYLYQDCILMIFLSFFAWKSLGLTAIAPSQKTGDT